MATNIFEMLGTVRPDGTLVLDQKVSVAPGRVKVRLEPVELPMAEENQKKTDIVGAAAQACWNGR